jgi:hypothetical protein
LAPGNPSLAKTWNITVDYDWAGGFLLPGSFAYNPTTNTYSHLAIELLGGYPGTFENLTASTVSNYCATCTDFVFTKSAGGTASSLGTEFTFDVNGVEVAFSELFFSFESPLSGQNPIGFSWRWSGMDCFRACDTIDFEEDSENDFGTGFVTPTPLPGALPMFVTGISALGLLGWHTKRSRRVLGAA